MLINKEMLLDSLKNREWLYYEDAAFAVNHIVEQIRDFPEAVSADEFAQRLKQPDEIRRALYRIIDALNFQDRLLAEPNCNGCLRGNCTWRPKAGETVRFNCMHWTDEDPGDYIYSPNPEEEKHPKINLDKDRGLFVGVGHELKPEINSGDLVELINKVFFTGGDSAKKEDPR